MIPKQLKDLRFCRIKKGSKAPFEKDWTNKPYTYEMIGRAKGENYGVICGLNNLAVIDCDKEELSLAVKTLLPETYSVKTGGGGMHYYYFIPELKKKIVLNAGEEHLGEIQSHGTQVVGAGSIHPNGKEYKIIDNVGIKEISLEMLMGILGKFMVKEEEEDTEKKKETGELTKEIAGLISFEDLLKSYGLTKKGNNWNCAFHKSEGGQCLSVDEKGIYNCFHCNKKGNIINFVSEVEEITIQEAIKKLKKQEKQGVGILSRRGQIESFWEGQPFFYDKSKIFWLWNKEMKKWELSDEVDYLNSIQETLGIDTIGSKARIELVEGFKQIGRKHKPREMEKSWVQFKEKIYDVKTGEEFEATPEYFVTNPIPWNVGESEETPSIDKLLVEWVGEENKQSLYEFIAYNISLDKFMQRLFAFCGGGSNGKGTFIKLNYRFLGKENCVSSEIKQLSENQFEPAVLFRKLLCVMGEVSYDDLKNTNMLKKLGGEDMISFQFKSKTPFTDENTATCVSLTNSLPTTPDKSIGFYRKWKIEDFPNQFKELYKDLIEGIPEVEFENLAKKSLRILKELYESKKFHNEGDFEERRKRYEERSNPIMQFIEEHCEEVEGENIILRDFTNACNTYLKDKHLRVMTALQVGKALRTEGFLVGNRKVDDISYVVILNLKYNQKLLELSKLSKSQVKPYIETTQKVNSSNSSNSSQRELQEKIEVVRPGKEKI